MTIYELIIDRSFSLKAYLYYVHCCVPSIRYEYNILFFWSTHNKLLTRPCEGFLLMIKLFSFFDLTPIWLRNLCKLTSHTSSFVYLLGTGYKVNESKSMYCTLTLRPGQYCPPLHFNNQPFPEGTWECSLTMAVRYIWPTIIRGQHLDTYQGDWETKNTITKTHTFTSYCPTNFQTSNLRLNWFKRRVALQVKVLCETL